MPPTLCPRFRSQSDPHRALAVRTCPCAYACWCDVRRYAWSPIFFFLVILTGSVLVFLGLSAASVRNVLHIAIAKPFFLGDIIHIHTANAPGGIGESITGFVENFTFAHIVIRSFDVRAAVSWSPL